MKYTVMSKVRAALSCEGGGESEGEGGVRVRVEREGSESVVSVHG